MVKFLMVLIFAVSSATAQAKVKGEDIIAGIIGGIIIGKIIKHQKEKDKEDDFVWEDQSDVILKDVGSQLILGTVVMPTGGSTEIVSFPSCEAKTGNKRLNHLRFRVDQADVYVRSIRITYQNGERENVYVDDVFSRKTSSDWYRLDQGNRCIKQIRVSGEALGSGKTWKDRNAVLTFVGNKTNSF